jgi:hypothetical protein
VLQDYLTLNHVLLVQFCWYTIVNLDNAEFWSVGSSILRQESRIFLLGVLRSWSLGSSILVLEARVV